MNSVIIPIHQRGIANIQNSCIFAVHNFFINGIKIRSLSQRLGRQVGGSPILILRFHYRGLCIDLPYFSIFKFFKMHNPKNTKPTHEQLVAIAEHIQSLHPELRKIRVKRYYDRGRLRARACLGNRQLRVFGDIATLPQRFSALITTRLSEPHTIIYPKKQVDVAILT